MQHRTEQESTTDPLADRALPSPAFVEPRLVKRGTLPEITWFNFSHPD